MEINNKINNTMYRITTLLDGVKQSCIVTEEEVLEFIKHKMKILVMNGAKVTVSVAKRSPLYTKQISKQKY